MPSKDRSYKKPGDKMKHLRRRSQLRSLSSGKLSQSERRRRNEQESEEASCTQ